MVAVGTGIEVSLRWGAGRLGELESGSRWGKGGWESVQEGGT